MAADRYTFFLSFYESLKELPPEEFMQIITAMCEKVFYDRDTELSGHVKSLYMLIEPVILKSVDISQSRSMSGKKGGAPKGNTNASKQPKLSKNNQKQADKEKEKDIGIRSMERGRITDSTKTTPANTIRFSPPSIEEVSAYCRERNNHINPDSFIDYYSSNGWKVGSSAMKDWKAAVRTWEHRDKNKDNMKQNHMMTNHYTSEDFVELEKKLLEN